MISKHVGSLEKKHSETIEAQRPASKNYRANRATVGPNSSSEKSCAWRRSLSPSMTMKDPMLHDEHLYSPVAESLFASLCDQTTLIDFKCGGVQVVGT